MRKKTLALIAGCIAATGVTTSAVADNLEVGHSLAVGQVLQGHDSLYFATLQPDGNFVVYRNSDSKAVWSSGTYGSGAAGAIMQSDGNFVIYKADGTAVWSTHTTVTAGSPNAFTIDNDGVPTVFAYVPIWTTGTHTPSLPSAPPRSFSKGATFDAGVMYNGPNNTGLIFQGDGNFVLYRAGAIWASYVTSNAGGMATRARFDGTLSTWNDTGPVWNSTPLQFPAGFTYQAGQRVNLGVDESILVMQDDANVAIYFAARKWGGAPPVKKYFGYFGGDYDSASAANPGGTGFAEMQDHINLYSILLWSADTTPAKKAESQAYVLSELAKAKAAHVQAIVPAYAFVFQVEKDSSGNIKCFHYDSNAAAAWQTFSQAMVDQGYLVPGHPEQSTVAAAYIMDEPNGDVCLSDINGQVNPAFANAINAIRIDPNSKTIPIASILTPDFDSFTQGMKLLDWVGYDHYGDSDATWQSRMADLKARTPGKKYIIAPGAMDGCDQVTKESPDRYINSLDNDPDVTWLVPFAWFSGKDNNRSCKGVRDLPDLRARYTAEGLKWKAVN